ncbi:MAG: prolyl oligopeptidase family serine peptidase [Pseudomonadota bacterium]
MSEEFVMTDVRPTPEAPDDDPYLWLEEVEGDQALAWIERQNGRTLAAFGGDVWKDDSAILAGLLDRPDNIPFVRRRGDLLYNFWKDADNPRGLWRTTTLESYRTNSPNWSVVLDLDELARQEGEDWIWSGASLCSEDRNRAMIGLSPGGSDAAEQREFDMVSRTFKEDGFRLPCAKSRTSWLDKDTLLVMSPLGEDMETTSGYARTARLWQRGKTFDAAPVLFDVPKDYMLVGAARVLKRDPETLLFVALPSFFEREYWIGDRSGAKQKLELPEDVDAELYGETLLVRLRTAWQTGGTEYAAGALLATEVGRFLNGDRDFTVAFRPNDRRVLQYWVWVGDDLVLSILDNLKPVFQVLNSAGQQPVKLSGLPELGVVNVAGLDADPEDSDGTLIGNAQDPLTPPTLMIQTSRSDDWDVLKRAPEAFDAQGLECTRHEATSGDGVQIPYMQIGPKGNPTGEAPVHLYGYGGFEVATQPNYRIGIGKLWLEHGGTSVLANIRGGGEFGPGWHEAGRREKKRLSHDDFAAVAADLVARGVTRPERIAAEGGSNGGILISNMFTRFPDRFGALFCTIPLIDMRRYTKLLAGASWIAEYGDPDVPEDWAFLQTYSAYHQAQPPKPGKVYPKILLATTRRDDRVHPGHARKMAAKLHALGHEAYFYEPAAGGHGYGKDNSEAAAFTALGFRFLREGIGWKA